MKHILAVGLILTLLNCSETTSIQLNEQAIKSYQMGNSVKAIELLNKAILIDPNNLLSYQNKLMILQTSGLRKEAIKLQQRLLAISPENPINYMRLGMFYELENDSLRARIQFESADSLFKVILDTLNQETDPQFSIAINNAQNLKMLGKQSEANHLLLDIKEKVKPKQLKLLLEGYISMNKIDFLKQLQ